MSIHIPELILIDLDGTLIDSVPDLAYAVDEMLMALELPQQGERNVRKWIGNGIERLVKRALTGELHEEPERSLFERALPLFRTAYTRCNGRNSVLYPGVREGLEWMTSQNYPLVCITNKAEQFTVPLLKSLKVFDFFQSVISGDTLPKQKPDPLPLLYAAEQCKVKPENALLIGDSINDVQAARAAGYQVVCVPYGYNHGQDIREAHPDAVINSFVELAQLLGTR